MSSMSTRFGYVIYVDMDWYAVGRHILTWIIRSTASNELYVDMFWLRHLCRHEKFRELNILISKLGTSYSFASNCQESNFVNIV